MIAFIIAALLALALGLLSREARKELKAFERTENASADHGWRAL